MLTTGLLDRLIKYHKYNVKEWLEETLSRQYGMCVQLRDDGWLSKEQIIEKLSGIENNTYVPPEPKLLTKEDALEAHKSNIKYYKNQLKEALALKQKYDEVIYPQFIQLKKVAEKMQYDLLISVLQGAEQQLDILKEVWDEDTLNRYKEEINKPFEYDEAKAMEMYQEDLVRYNEHMKKKEELIDFSAGYRKFLKELDEAFNMVVKQ